jgi:hypothetical protein
MPKDNEEIKIDWSEYGDAPIPTSLTQSDDYMRSYINASKDLGNEMARISNEYIAPYVATEMASALPLVAGAGSGLATIPAAMGTGQYLATGIAAPIATATAAGYVANMIGDQTLAALGYYGNTNWDKEYGKSDPASIRPLLDAMLGNVNNVTEITNNPEWRMRNPTAAGLYDWAFKKREQYNQPSEEITYGM